MFPKIDFPHILIDYMIMKACWIWLWIYITSMLPWPYFYLVTGAQYTILIKLVICAWQHWETITNGSHRKKSIWLSPFFPCTDQLQVHNNKHPPTQKKKFKEQAMLIRFQWNFLSLKKSKTVKNPFGFTNWKFYNFSAPTKKPK